MIVFIFYAFHGMPLNEYQETFKVLLVSFK